jgi:hypothetical protein
MNRGWVSLWRKLQDNPVFQKPELLKVFIWCLLKATHAESRVLIDCQEIKLQPGQFIYGRKKAAKELSMAESSVRNYIDFLAGERDHVGRHEDRELDIFSRSNYSIITLRNWNKYQKSGQQSGQRQDTYNNKNNGGTYREPRKASDLNRLDKFKRMHKLNEEVNSNERIG